MNEGDRPVASLPLRPPRAPHAVSGQSPATASDPRALALLKEVQDLQKHLPRGPALGWERVAFAMAFLDDEPRRRVRAFLSKGK